MLSGLKALLVLRMLIWNPHFATFALQDATSQPFSNCAPPAQHWSWALIFWSVSASWLYIYRFHVLGGSWPTWSHLISQLSHHGYLLNQAALPTKPIPPPPPVLLSPISVIPSFRPAVNTTGHLLPYFSPSIYCPSPATEISNWRRQRLLLVVCVSSALRMLAALWVKWTYLVYI